MIGWYCNNCKEFVGPANGPAHVCTSLPIVVTGGYVPPPPCESCVSLRRENAVLSERLKAVRELLDECDRAANGAMRYVPGAVSFSTTVSTERVRALLAAPDTPT